MTHTSARPATPESLDPAVLDRVVWLLVSLRSIAAVTKACGVTLQLSVSQTEQAIAEGLRVIKLASSMDFDHELGCAKTRLEELYEKSVTGRDIKLALAVQKELNKLLSLYPSGVPIADGADDSVFGELAACRAHLATLVETSDDEPVDEIARRVVGLFTSRDKPNASRRRR